MEILNLESYIIPIVTVFCLGIGFCLKPIGIIPNKAIPLLLAVVGIIGALFVNRDFAPETIVGGMFSGLLSTGLYEAFANYLKKPPILFDDEATDVRDDIEIKEGDEDYDEE